MKTILHSIEGTENEYIETKLFYDLGGYNYFTYKTDRRGYYASVKRVSRSNGMHSSALFDGRKILLKEVKRQSKKAEAEAEQIMMDNYEKWMKVVYPDVNVSTGCTII